jgi:nicotinamidase-related amidase
VSAPAKNQDLHGNVPDQSSVVLVLIDVINDFEFEGADEIFHNTMLIAQNLTELRRRAKSAGIPVVYANDNFGKWRSDFRKLVEHCLNDNVKGKPLAEMLRPDEDDYFVLKPKHSAFYSTTLDVLLVYLKARTLILAGITGNICVLFSASDAYMRDYELIIPADCIASPSHEDNLYALAQIKNILKANTATLEELGFLFQRHPKNSPR